MKSTIKKPKTLSPNQELLWNACNNCDSKRALIADKAGVSEKSIYLWLSGKVEPGIRYVEWTIEAIRILNSKKISSSGNAMARAA